ncbi:hypothetical protein [Aeromonas sp. sif2416]|uniref:hypothetical protein n=1 Tax=Aeromonas sp. sif2416 TaxID=2854793 RepID=UPI001C43C552|nr:hypothetical protein [Aeromonas sp. sif2416]MBV7439415.1 hypothetical protein [Aeromonas sp. sif2416]
MITKHPAFIPVLTVMVDYGWAPFLWLKESPDELGYVNCNIGDGKDHYEDDLMSEELWEQFSPWALEFNRTMYDDHALDPDCWDWAVFHERGLRLARLLKAEVGDTYRVLYCKPVEDPAFKQNEYREVLADGTFVPVPLHPDRSGPTGLKE